MSKKRIMSEFRINEISAVTSPAQEGAKAVIMKSADHADSKSERRFEKGIGSNDLSRKPFGLAAPTTFAEATSLIRARDRVPRTVAMQRARREFGTLFGKMQADPATSRPVYSKADRPAPVQKFEALVTSIEKRDQCSRLDALRKAADRHPDELESYRRAQA